jgi:anti-anti-sigma regulatory factor
MTLTQERQVILFQPQGSINLQVGTDLSEKMAKIIPQPDQLWGLVPLVQALKTVRKSGCRLVICNVQAPVRLVLELTHLDSVFEIVNNYHIPDSTPSLVSTTF